MWNRENLRNKTIGLSISHSRVSKITVLTVFQMGKGTLLNGEGGFEPVLHVPLKSWASGFRIKATPVDRFIGCVCLKKDFVPEGKGTLCPIFKKFQAKKLTHENNQGHF